MRFKLVAAGEAGYPGTLQDPIQAGTLTDAAKQLTDAPEIDLATVTLLPPFSHTMKIICIGLN